MCLRRQTRPAQTCSAEGIPSCSGYTNFTVNLTTKDLTVWAAGAIADGFWVKVTMPAPVNGGRDLANVFSYDYF